MPLGIAALGRVLPVVLLVVTACAAPEALTLPTRPPIPDGWVQIDMGTVRVAVPAEWGPDIGGMPGFIQTSALLPPDDDDGVGVIAVGPRGETQPEAPFTDERLEEFLLKWVSNRPPDSFSRSIVLLPAGRAVVVRATYYAATPHSTEVHTYGIPTSVGVAVIQIAVDTDLMDRYATAMELIPYLFEFGFAESR